MITDFKTSNYFTGMPYVLGFVLVPIGFGLLFSPKFIVGAVILSAGVVMLTTHVRLTVDLKQKKYTEYISLVGLKLDKEIHSFEQLEYVFIKKKRVSQTLHSRVSSNTIQKDQFDGYLKFSENDKVHLMTFDSRENLVKRLRPIATSLNTRIIDYSADAPVEVK